LSSTRSGVGSNPSGHGIWRRGSLPHRLPTRFRPLRSAEPRSDHVLARIRSLLRIVDVSYLPAGLPPTEGDGGPLKRRAILCRCFATSFEWCLHVVRRFPGPGHRRLAAPYETHLAPSHPGRPSSPQATLAPVSPAHMAFGGAPAPDASQEEGHSRLPGGFT
jgi:hypothetical protein